MTAGIQVVMPLDAIDWAQVATIALLPALVAETIRSRLHVTWVA